MPFYQYDTSGLVKRYVDEVGSAWVRAIVNPVPANIVSIADITRVEVTSALARRTRKGIITLNERNELIQTFQAHCATQYRIVPTQPRVIILPSNLFNVIRSGLMTRCSWLLPVLSIKRSRLMVYHP
jgi:hypothetical protein